MPFEASPENPQQTTYFNVVGYNTLTIKPGWNMLAVNFKDINNTEGILLNDLFLGTGDEATCPFHADINLNTADNIQIFDAATQGYTAYYLYYTFNDLIRSNIPGISSPMVSIQLV